MAAIYFPQTQQQAPAPKKSGAARTISIVTAVLCGAVLILGAYTGWTVSQRTTWLGLPDPVAQGAAVNVLLLTMFGALVLAGISALASIAGSLGRNG